MLHPQRNPALNHLKPLRILLLGATGTVGQATLIKLLEQGHDVTCFVRQRPTCFAANVFDSATFRFGDVTSAKSLKDEGFCGDDFEAVVSCLASRSGAPDDAWAIDYQAHSNALQISKVSGVKMFVLLSAICVQKPRLAFQHAKLAFEQELQTSGLTYSIVRPTALFKSLSGQIERLRKGKSFLMFGDGKLTSCKPISDSDLADFLTRCLRDANLQNRILPVGGPAPAITPRQQGEFLFELLRQKPRFVRIPIGVLDVIIGALTVFGTFNKGFASKAEFARIAKYYATESMLCLDPVTGAYDAEATPSTGSEHISHFYSKQIATGQEIDLANHAMF
jgi:divinyl chlorophyllide a 8-vinyl-reductase